MRVEVSEAGGSNLPNSVTPPNKRQQLPAKYDRTNRANPVDVFAEMRLFPLHHWNCAELSVCPNQNGRKSRPPGDLPVDGIMAPCELQELLPIAAICVTLRQKATLPIVTDVRF